MIMKDGELRLESKLVGTIAGDFSFPPTSVVIAGAQMRSNAYWMISTVMARAITASSQLWCENY